MIITIIGIFLISSSYTYYVIMSSMKETCPICLESLRKKNYCITECNHKYCLSCLLTHLEYSELCPLCRKKLVTKKRNKMQEEFLTAFFNILR